MAKKKPKLTPNKKKRPSRLPGVGTDTWKEAFLNGLRSMPVVRVACQVAGISRETAYHWRNKDEGFKAEWAEAWEDGIDLLEATLMKRARETDTTAAIFMLKGLRPEKWNEKYFLMHSSPPGAPVKVEHEHTHKVAIDFDSFSTMFSAVVGLGQQHYGPTNGEPKLIGKGNGSGS